MNHISLFSGIGGAELAAEWAGWRNVLSCDINEFGNKILEYYWSEAYHHTDIHTLNYDTINAELTRRFGNWREEGVIITGGFPCQPYSAAGKRKGTEDARHLWPEMLRIIREVSPDWVVGENVYGLVNWSGGLVFEQVQTDLEACGYEVQPVILPACGVNAPHKRDRVWFVAHRSGMGREPGPVVRGTVSEKIGRAEPYIRDQSQVTPDPNDTRTGINLRSDRIGQEKNKRRERQPQSESGKNSRIVTDPNGDQRCEGGMHKTRLETTERHIGSCDARNFGRTDWDNFPTQPPVCGKYDGIPRKLDGITFSKWRNESIKGFGNAWVPEVALQIFQAINEYES